MELRKWKTLIKIFNFKDKHEQVNFFNLNYFEDSWKSFLSMLLRKRQNDGHFTTLKDKSFNLSKGNKKNRRVRHEKNNASYSLKVAKVNN